MSKDLYRGPDGVLYQLDAEQDGSGMVSLYTQGGGRIYRVPTRYFQAQFKLDGVGEYRPSVVTIDGSGVNFKCWLRDDHWNGWEKPVFTIEQLGEMLKFFCDVEHDTINDVVRVLSNSVYDVHETFLPRMETLNGVATKVYPIGAGSWTWDEVTVTVEEIEA